MKAMIATTYAEYETTIVDDRGMEHIDGVGAGPVGGSLKLQFHRALVGEASLL